MRAVLGFIATAVIAGCTSWLWNHSAEAPKSSSNVPTINGLVVNITDGDTLDVLFEQRQIRIRLVEIDAPERNQAFGERSTESLIHRYYLQSQAADYIRVGLLLRSR